MAKNTKTPVMVLQELAVKKSTVPEYELIFSQQGTHENIFHYQVLLLGVRAVGTGRSKKEAKHKAASKALELLAERNIFHPDMEAENCTNTEVYHQEHAQTKAPLNYIPKLLDICTENKIPPATFVEISDVGPPHCREFTYECRINSITTRATAGSKKHAKQITAKDMLSRIINILPALREETDQLMIPSDEEVIRKFNTCLPLGRVNFNSKVIEYDLQFKNLMAEMEIPKEPIMKVLEMPPSENSLQELLGLFDLEYQLKTLQESPPLVMVDIYSETPVTVIDSGKNLEEATSRTVAKTLLILKMLII